MTVFLVIIHVLVSLFLIFIVLIQSSKGAELGATFGGSSQTLFGSRGGATFMSKLTTGSAVAFMITSFLLAVVSVRSGSIVKKMPVPVEQRSGIPAQSGPLQAPQQPVQTPQAQPAQPAPQPHK